METKLLKYTIKYTNQKEYHAIKDEIFSNNIYEFESESENPKIIDIGAHIGLSVLYFKREFPSSQIIAFEPNPKLFEILKENIFINNLKDIEVKQKAVTNSTGKSKFYIDPTVDEWFSTGSLINGGWTKREDSVSIEVENVKLSEYINEEVDMLKVDVEGSELEILNEAKSKLYLVKNIAIEYHPDTNFNKIVNILKSTGFTLTFIQNGKEVATPDSSRLLIIKGRR